MTEGAVTHSVTPLLLLLDRIVSSRTSEVEHSALIAALTLCVRPFVLRFEFSDKSKDNPILSCYCGRFIPQTAYCAAVLTHGTPGS